nr:Lrp/AsnC family transcriptional regulator [Nocardioides soli]
MKSRKPRTALTGVPSGAAISGTPKKARKYIEAESRSISRPAWESVTAASSHAIGSSLSAVSQPELEATDRKILELLAGDGRMSFTDLGKSTGLSTSAVHQRVKRLEQRGLILGYGATIDHEQLGLPLTAFISIRPIDPSQPDDSPERLRGIGEIESCWSVAGDESYILKVRVAAPTDLEDLLARVRAAANVSTRTTIVLSTPYENRSVV